MPDRTATTRHGVTKKKRNAKRLRHTENLFRKNLQLLYRQRIPIFLEAVLAIEICKIPNPI